MTKSTSITLNEHVIDRQSSGDSMNTATEVNHMDLVCPGVRSTCHHPVRDQVRVFLLTDIDLTWNFRREKGPHME